MGPFAVGDILVVRFPFSDLSHSKARPAVVVGHSDFDNVILCQITSKAPDTAVSLRITAREIRGQNLLRSTSYVQANKLFTADSGLVARPIGRLTPLAQRRLHTKLVETFAELAHAN